MVTTSAPHRQQNDLPPQYVPGDVEAGTYDRWVAAGYFAAEADSGKPPFSLVLPPPNITGSMHIGTAYEHTLMDVVIRRKRMQGAETLWVPGTDHASIATQNVIERQLVEEGTSRQDLGREKFLARAWQWKEESTGKIQAQMRRLGDSVDWAHERFTMDEGLSRAVQTIFKRLYDDDLIYRAERIINWCPRCGTAISDIEVEHADEDGELVSIRYGTSSERAERDDGADSVVVATTRVETMLGDTAVAVHPDDERYAHLVGREIELPLTGRRIPVVADEHVDPAFGTGAVKVTPAHDPNDFEIGQRHGLAMPVIMDERAAITVPGPFQGMDRFEARPAITQALREEGRIVAEKRPYSHAVGHCSRCKTVVEPRLSLQWFVRVGPLAQAAGDAVRDGRVQIHPPEMAKRYFDWVENMHDWTISRQQWWGHRIPIWYGPAGEVVCVGPDDEAPTGEGWRQDEDILDTWFSSGLWPFSTLGWPDQTPDLAKFYPTSLLITGYDIVFFWVARMMMFGLYAMDGEPPFRMFHLHGMVRDAHGKKMSRSFGNVVDPLEWMDTYGADALRFTFARGANPGVDVPISEDWVKGSRNFCNKLWNAARFAMLNGADARAELPPADRLSTVDRWILSRLSTTIADVDGWYEGLEFARAADAIYHFAWDEVCDWYVELAKPALAGPDADATRAVLGHVLDELLRLLHPIAPYLTESLWQALTGGESVVIASWPVADESRVDSAAEMRMRLLQQHVGEFRRFRAEQGVKPSLHIGGRANFSLDGFPEYESLLRSLARVDDPTETFAATTTLLLGGLSATGTLTLSGSAGGSASAGSSATGTLSLSGSAGRSVDGGLTGSGQLSATVVELDLSGAIDVVAERRRLERDLVGVQKELAQVRAKLANPQFTGKAPEAVVAKVRARLAAAEADLTRIQTQLDALPTA